MTDQILIAQVQQALHAAADKIHVNTSIELPAPDAGGERNTTRRRPAAQRWLLPAAAAAAVIILLATGVFFWHQNQTVATATRVSISGDLADVGGVRFPVPPGWDVAVTKSDAKAVHVCVAVNPAADCDGVQFDIAVPGWFGNTELLTSGTLPMFDQCPAGITSEHIIMTDDHNPIDVAGRPGIHMWGYCGNSSTTSHLWQLNDLSLQIYSPPGRYVTQISAIVAGLDLTQWAHHQGPQAAFITSGSTAPPTS